MGARRGQSLSVAGLTKKAGKEGTIANIDRYAVLCRQPPRSGRAMSNVLFKTGSSGLCSARHRVGLAKLNPSVFTSSPVLESVCLSLAFIDHEGVANSK